MRIKKFNNFNILTESAHSHEYIDKILDELKKYPDCHNHFYFYLVDPIYAGDIDGYRAYVNQVHIGSFDSSDGIIDKGLCLNVIYDKQWDDLYKDYSWKFTSVTSYDLERQETDIIEYNDGNFNTRKNIDIIFYSNLLPKIYDKMIDPEVIKINKEFIDIRNKIVEIRHKAQKENRKYTLEEYKIHKKNDHYFQWLSYNMPNSIYKKEWEDVKDWNQHDYDSYKKKQEKQSEYMKGIFDKLFKNEKGE